MYLQYEIVPVCCESTGEVRVVTRRTIRFGTGRPSSKAKPARATPMKAAGIRKNMSGTCEIRSIRCESRL